MSADEPKAWERYEDVGNYLVEKLADALGLGLERVEGKQTLVGQATDYTVEGKGVTTEDGEIVIIECRRLTTSRINQEDMGGIAYRIGHVGAAGGIVVTPIGVQEGARKIAEYEGIKIVRLDANATTTDFMLEFLDKVIAGRSAKFGGKGTLTVAVEAVQPDKPEPKQTSPTVGRRAEHLLAFNLPAATHRNLIWVFHLGTRLKIAY